MHSGLHNGWPILLLQYHPILLPFATAATFDRKGGSPGLDGEYRYTEWVGFNTPGFPHRPDWSDNAGTELYRHLDGTAELVNLADHPQYEAVRLEFSRRLRTGPTTGGGWGFEKQG